jgi:hypothetical protein
MKNESRIEELLAESLRRQDRHEELLKKLTEGQNKLIDLQVQSNTRLNLHEEVLKSLLDGQHRLIDLQEATNKRLDTHEDIFRDMAEKMDIFKDKQEELKIEVSRIAFFLERVFDLEKRFSAFETNIEERISRLEQSR